MRLIWWLCMICFTLEEVCYGKTIVEMKFEQFENPRNQLASGRCCEVNFIQCLFECDHWFKICIKPSLAAADSLVPCKQSLSTYVISQKKQVFNDSLFIIGRNVTNPWTFEYNGAFNGFGMDIEVWDDDGGNPRYPKMDSLVEKYTRNLIFPPGASKKELNGIKQFSLGKNTQLRFGLRAFCSPNYYGKDCSTRCVKHDDDKGHFTCNVKTGAKICMSGWSGQDCHTHVQIPA